MRPVASTTCDLDGAIVAGATPFAGPFAIGHECVAEVIDVGDDAGTLAAASASWFQGTSLRFLCPLPAGGYAKRRRPRVLIMGGTPSIGLYVAMFATAVGAGTVDYVDRDVANPDR